MRLWVNGGTGRVEHGESPVVDRPRVSTWGTWDWWRRSMCRNDEDREGATISEGAAECAGRDTACRPGQTMNSDQRLDPHLPFCVFATRNGDGNGLLVSPSEGAVQLGAWQAPPGPIVRGDRCRYMSDLVWIHSRRTTVSPAVVSFASTRPSEGSPTVYRDGGPPV